MSMSYKARRKKVWLKDKGICRFCKVHTKQGLGNRKPTIDHILPKRLGGTNAMENLRLLHLGCHTDLNVVEQCFGALACYRAIGKMPKKPKKKPQDPALFFLPTPDLSRKPKQNI